MPRVQVQGVGVVQFPDDMPPDQIATAIERDILPRVATNKPDVGAARKQIAEETGPLESVAIGAGRVVDRTLAGVKQAILGGWLPESMQFGDTKAKLAELKATQDGNNTAYQALQEAHPLATTGGEILATLPVGAVGTGYRAAMAAGALPAMLEYGTAGEKVLGGAAGAAGGAAGQALGNLVGKFVRRGADVPLADAERAALVDAAQRAGYDLRPDQITGKTWQRNLAAALQQNPVTSGAMESHAAKQAATTERLVDSAVNRAGGYIDQPSAGAAASTGITKGLEAEAAKINTAYKDLLAGRDVDIEALRPVLTQILDQQKALPEHLQGSPAVEGLRQLLGDQNYAAKARTPFARPALDETKDDIITAIRKLGGVSPEDEAVGSLAKANPFANDPRLGPVWRRPAFATSAASNTSAGHSLDRMSELLRERGYPVQGPNDVMDAIAEAGIGRPIYSDAFDHRAAQAAEDPLAVAIAGLNQRLDAKAAPKPAAPGYLRDNPTVDGELAQDMRSGYRIKSEDAYARSKNAEGDAWREMRDAMDGVIRKALPSAEKEQFDAINTRYGLGVALKVLPKRDQQTLLKQIYRGFNSEDEFAAFIAMSPDKEFKEVARGFLSDLVDRARDKAGNVSAARLGRATRGADDEAMRLLGGDSARELATVGRIGETLLPDIGNSQTSNRAVWLRALQNPLTLAGAGLGGAGGSGEGGPGAIAGAAAGAFLAPKIASKVFLSDLAQRAALRSSKAYSGVPGLRDIDPKIAELLVNLLRGSSAGLGMAASD